MRNYNNISIGFDTFDRGMNYSDCTYTCNCSSPETISCSPAIVAGGDNNYHAEGYNYYIDNKYNDLQNEINVLKEQMNKMGQSAKNAGTALKSMCNHFGNNKVSLRSQLQTLTEWQTI